MAFMGWLFGDKKKGPNRSAMKDVNLGKLRRDTEDHDYNARMAAKGGGDKKSGGDSPGAKKPPSIGESAKMANNDKTKAFWKNTYDQIHKKKK